MDPESRAILDQLVRRISDLEMRLARIDGGVPQAVQQAQQAFAPPPQYPPQQQPVGPPPQFAAGPPMPPPDFGPPPDLPENAYANAAASTSPGKVETQAGLVWVNRIGAITLILGAAFFFKYAVDNDWIGPAGRVILGMLAAVLALFAGDQLWHRGHKVFAQGITALGVCLLYLDFWAAFGLYKLIPQGAAFALLIVATAASGALALRYNARVIALLALIGGYGTPFLLSTGEPNDWFFGSYMLAVNAVGVWIARRQNWRVVEIVALVATIGLHGAWFANRREQFGPLMCSLFALAQYAIFALQPVSWQAVVAQIATAGGIAVVFHSAWHPQYFAVAGVLAAAGIVWSAVQKRDIHLLASLFGWAIGLAIWDPALGAEHYAGNFLAIAIAFLVYLASILFIRYQPPGVPLFSTLALNGIFFYGMSYQVLDKNLHSAMGLLAVGVGASYLMAAMRLRGQAAPKAAMLGAGLALAFLTLAIPIQLTGFSITLAWAVEAAALAFIASRLNSVWAVGGSWFVGWLVVMRLVLNDSGNYWPQPYDEYKLLMNSRFIPFLVSAISLALVAFWTSKVERVPKMVAGIPLAFAHAVMLWGLHLEAFAFIGARHEATADTTSLRTLTSSVLLALYGLALIAIGLMKSEKFHRLAGLLLFAIVILKLYAFDIWLLGLGYRIVAFVALGGLLLASSYLYSRYRNRIAALWKNETPPA